MFEVSYYHGAADSVSKLTPRLINNLLYPTQVSTDRELAVEKGLLAVLEKTHILKSFKIVDSKIIIDLENKSPILTRSMLDKLVVYLYTIKPTIQHKWTPCKDEDNVTVVGCFETHATVQPRDRARLQMNIWLTDYRVYIKHARF